MTASIEDAVLRSLRRINRAVDLHSCQLASLHQLTGPQLVCLRAIDNLGTTTPSVLAREVSLSQATLTGIVDRLDKRGLVERRRDKQDRRRVLLRSTEAGRQLVEQAPSPLQDTLAANLRRLPADEQERLAATLQQVVRMMEADALDASPMLTTGPVTATGRQVLDFLEPGTDEG